MANYKHKSVVCTISCIEYNLYPEGKGKLPESLKRALSNFCVGKYLQRENYMGLDHKHLYRIKKVRLGIAIIFKCQYFVIFLMY